MVKIYHVNETKFNQLVQENVRMIINLPISDVRVTNISEFYPQDGGRSQLAQIWNEITSLSSYVYKKIFVLNEF